MSLTLILGPMKSGKSFELIAHFAPLKYSNITFALYQPEKNTRDSKIISRVGSDLEAKKIKSLEEIESQDIQIIGIDEIHMFKESEVESIAKLLRKGVQIIAAGLDMDYRGKIFEIIKNLFELGPKEVKYKRSACEVCKSMDASHTQILYNEKPLTSGLPSVCVEDGTYKYIAVCRHCFVQE